MSGVGQPLMSWYEVRDTLLGQNYKKQDVKRALGLAAVCQHEDALWLNDMCSRNNVTSAWEISRVFVRYGSDARALCFSAAIDGDEERMRQSARMGYAFAQAWLAKRGRREEIKEWAQKAAAQGERDGYCCLHTKEGFLRASELGCVESMKAFALLLGESDPQRFFWLGRAASHGASLQFREEFHKQVCLGRPDTVFAIGRALKGHVNFEANKLFGIQYGYNWVFGSVKLAIDFFEARILAVRHAVDAWTFVGMRLHVVKDIRRMIAELIWKARDRE